MVRVFRTDIRQSSSTCSQVSATSVPRSFFPPLSDQFIPADWERTSMGRGSGGYKEDPAPVAGDPVSIVTYSLTFKRPQFCTLATLYRVLTFVAALLRSHPARGRSHCPAHMSIGCLSPNLSTWYATSAETLPQHVSLPQITSPIARANPCPALYAFTLSVQLFLYAAPYNPLP